MTGEQIETIGERLGTPEIAPPGNSQIIVIRHGATKYTQEYPDLTETGIEQLQATADRLQHHLTHFDEVWVVSSIAARARGSRDTFMNQIDLQACVNREYSTIRPMDIKDFGPFLAHDKEHSTDIYGQRYLTDPLTTDENDLVESRMEIARRSNIYLRNMADFVFKKSAETGKRIAVLTFCHMEILVEYMRELYGDGDFPILEHDAPQHGEDLIIELTGVPREVTVRGRGLERSFTIRPDVQSEANKIARGYSTSTTD